MTEEGDWLRADRSRLVAYGAGLFLLWSLATWVLEGRIQTLARPEATLDRLVYALIANLLVGIVGAALVLRGAVAGGLADPRELGLAGRGRTLVSVMAGTALGGVVLALGPVELTPLVALNTFAQTLVVSVAEVAVCFAVVGGSVAIFLRGTATPLRLGLAALAGAGAFGVYHFAHSPPYNSPELVLMLTQVGLASAAFYFLAGDVYGTIVFHNFLAARGVSEVLERSDRLEGYVEPRVDLLVTALVAVILLVACDLGMIRRVARDSTAEVRQPGERP